MGKLSDEAKSLMILYKDNISESYFRKLFNRLDGNLDAVVEAIENKIDKKNKKNNSPKYTKTNTKSNNLLISSYDIPTPDHIMSREEYWVFLAKHIRKSVYMLRGKYWTLKMNGIQNDDLISEILIKCVRKTRDGRDRYEEYLQNPECLNTIRTYINLICVNHFKDFLKGPRYTTPTVSLEKTLPGQDNLTLSDTLGKCDKDNLSVNELMERCQDVVIKGVRLSQVLNKVLEGYSFVTVCREYNLSPKVVRNRFINIGALELLGSNK